MRRKTRKTLPIAALLVILAVACASTLASGPRSSKVLVATGTGMSSVTFASGGSADGSKGSGDPGAAKSNDNGNTDPTTGCNSHGSCNGLPKDFGVAVGSVPGLYPGHGTTIPVRYANPYSFAISVIAASASVEGSAACPGSYVAAGSYSSTAGVLVARNGVVDTDLPIRLKSSAPDACQGVRFSITVTAQAVKS